MWGGEEGSTIMRVVKRIGLGVEERLDSLKTCLVKERRKTRLWL